jgi:hypothetical protein
MTRAVSSSDFTRVIKDLEYDTIDKNQKTSVCAEKKHQNNRSTAQEQGLR